MKRIKNTDFLFIIALSLGLLIHIFFLLIIPYFHDETHYATVPFRLVNGDSLIQHEWHLTQFASLFSYLPVRIWTAIKGSADGIFIFLRCVYLLIHTSIAVLIYRFFRKYGNWAILASIMFYVQITYRIQAISYQSMFVIFLLLLSLCLISVYKKESVHFYVFAGLCFGFCCVCNPLFCLAFALYLLCCILWTKRQILMNKVIELKTFQSSDKGKKITKKQKRQKKQQMLNTFPNIESYNCFFTKEAVFRFSCGILIAVVIAVLFFFLTGGTINSVFTNINNLLGSSEYDIASNSVFSKFGKTFEYFNRANLGMPWILPAIFVALLIDKKRKSNTHRVAYLSVSLLWSIIFIFAVLTSAEFKLFAISLPFSIMSAICYLLTENKNKTLFRCMCIPCLIAACVHYIAADTHLAAIGVVLAINNVAGVFFAMDLFTEMRSASENNSEATNNKGCPNWGRRIIITSFCVQILFYGIFYIYGQVPIKNAVKAEVGPYSGLYMTKEQYDQYNNSINDLDIIKNRTEKNEPVLLDTYNNWMYLHLNRSIATYTTWYRGSLNFNQLTNYYEENPEKIPKYIYIESPDLTSTKIEIAMDILNEMFEFSEKEALSNGVLLTVEDYKL